MTGLPYAGFFVLLCGLLMYRKAGTQAQRCASAVPIGIGGGMLVIAYAWGVL